MRRFLIISLTIVGGLILAALSGAVLLFNTTPGKRFIIAQAEPQIATALGGDAEIGDLSGALPGVIILNDVVLSDGGQPWLTIDRAEMRWRPVSLLGDSFHADLIVIEGARLLREPPERDDADEEPEPLRIELPDNLPSISVVSLRIDDFRSELTAAPARLDGAGLLAMGGRRINAALALSSSGDKDVIDAAIDIDPAQDRILVDVTIAAKADGVMAALAGIDEGFTIEASGDAPTNDAKIDVNTIFGAYGAATAEITSDFEAANALAIAVDFTPGERLVDIDALGERIRLETRIEKRENGGAIFIDQLSTGAGAMMGDGAWTNDRRGLASLEAQANFHFAEAFEPDLQAYIGKTAKVNVNLNRQRRDYSAVATLTSDRAAISLMDGVTDLAEVLTGRVTASLAPRDGAPSPINVGAAMEGALQIEKDREAAIHSLVLRIGEQSTISGDARYRFDNDAIGFEGDVDLTPSFVASLTPSIATQGNIAGTIEIDGPLDRFTAKTRLETPAATVNGETTPPLMLEAAIAGLPALPSGDISARAKNGGEGRFAASIRSAANGHVLVPSLTYANPLFNLTAAGAYDPNTQQIELDLAYVGKKGAIPWPGLPLEGDATIKGSIARKGAASDLRLAARRLTVNTISIDNLALTAKGPPSAIQVDLATKTVSAPDGRIIENIDADAVASLGDSTTVSLRELEADFGGVEANLMNPAEFLFEDGAAIRNFRLGWGPAGEIAFDGAFSDKRWRAETKLTQVNIPDTDGRIDLTASLDTDRETPASGTFQLRSLLAQGAGATFAGGFSWDGSVLHLTSAANQDTADMDIRLPARLVRSPKIGVDLDGEMSGAARYNGDIHVIAAYLPPALQSLEGVLSANVDLAGTLENPKIAGEAVLSNGAYTEQQTGFSLAGLHLDATAAMAPSGAEIDLSGGARGGGQTGDDTITLSGGLELGDLSTINMTVSLNDAEFSAAPIQSAKASGEINVSGPLNGVTATGDISVAELNAEIITPEISSLAPIEIVDASNGGDPADARPVVQPVNFNYDFNITAKDRIFIRGRGLESEWRANVEVLSLRGAPLIIGDVNLRRGWLDFAGRRFNLTQGRIAFDRLSQNNPTLGLRAEYQTSDGVTAIIAVTGRADAPKIELLSTPSLPSEDVMALVLFGKPAEELSAFESLQAAEALAALGGVGIFGDGGGITGTLRKAIGLDLLNIDVDPEKGGGSLTIGKYVTDGLFVSATQDALGKDGSVRIEYEVTDNITVESEIEQDGDQTVSANWKRDF